jgi:hypothetical protein
MHLKVLHADNEPTVRNKEMGRACSVYKKAKKYAQKFDQEN